MSNSYGIDVTGAITGRVIDRRDTRNGIGGIGVKKIHIRRAGCVEMCGSPDAGLVMATNAGLAGIDVDDTAMPGTIMLSLAVGPHVAGRSVTVRRQIMAGDTAARDRLARCRAAHASGRRCALCPWPGYGPCTGYNHRANHRTRLPAM